MHFGSTEQLLNGSNRRRLIRARTYFCPKNQNMKQLTRNTYFVHLWSLNPVFGMNLHSISHNKIFGKLDRNTTSCTFAYSAFTLVVLDTASSTLKDHYVLLCCQACLQKGGCRYKVACELPKLEYYKYQFSTNKYNNITNRKNTQPLTRSRLNGKL